MPMFLTQKRENDKYIWLIEIRFTDGQGVLICSCFFVVFTSTAHEVHVLDDKGRLGSGMSSHFLSKEGVLEKRKE